MGLPTFRSASGNGEGSAGSGSVAVTQPTGLQSGDWMVAFCSMFSPNVLADLGPPSGWALQSSYMTGPGPSRVAVYTRTAGGSEPSTYTFTNTGFNPFLMVGIAAYSGFTSLDAVAASGAVISGGTRNYATPDVSGQTPPTTDLLVVGGTYSGGFGGPNFSTTRLNTGTYDAYGLVIGDVAIDFDVPDFGHLYSEGYSQTTTDYYGAFTTAIAGSVTKAMPMRNPVSLAAVMRAAAI